MIYKIIRDNSWFFFGMLLFLIAGAIVLFSIQTGDAILFFSQQRTPALNQFFRIVTRLGEEPVYLLLPFLLALYRIRYALLVPLTGFAVMLTAFLTKALFGHDRPSIYFQKLDLFDQLNIIDGVTLLTGQTSFPSGHTMSAFGLYGMLALLLPWKKWSGLGLFIIALLIGISRIYLVQHFVKDVYAGAIIGVLIAIMIYTMQSRRPVNTANWYDRSLFNLRAPSKVAASGNPAMGK